MFGFRVLGKGVPDSIARDLWRVRNIADSTVCTMLHHLSPVRSKLIIKRKQYNEQGLTCYCTLHQPFASSACFQVSRNESAASSRQNCKAIEEEEKTCLKSFNFFSCGLALWLGTFVALPLCTILQKNIGQSSKTNQTVRVHLPLAFFSSTSCPQLL